MYSDGDKVNYLIMSEVYKRLKESDIDINEFIEFASRQERLEIERKLEQEKTLVWDSKLNKTAHYESYFVAKDKVSL